MQHVDNKSICLDLTEDEITSLREKYYLRALEAERRDGFQGLTMALIVLMVSAGIFTLHWKMAKRSSIN